MSRSWESVGYMRLDRQTDDEANSYILHVNMSKNNKKIIG